MNLRVRICLLPKIHVGILINRGEIVGGRGGCGLVGGAGLHYVCVVHSTGLVSWRPGVGVRYPMLWDPNLGPLDEQPVL